jgi:hypothetical protein
MKISEFQDKRVVDPNEYGPRKASEYRGALRNMARIAYRIAKKTMKQMQKNK